MKKIIILLIVFTVIGLPLHADKYAGEFLNIGVGVKARALGNAFTAIADDPTATYWNPAGIFWQNNLSFNLMHSEEFSGNLKYDALSGVYPLDENKKFGFLITRIGISGIPLTELADPDDSLSVHNPPHVYKYVNDADYVIYLSFSSLAYTKLSFGVTSKLIYRSIGDIKASGIGIDGGLLYKPVENINVGLTLRDIIGTTIWWKDGQTEVISPNMLVGFAWRFTFPIINVRSTLSLQSDIKFENRKESAQFNFGSTSLDFHAGLLFKIAPFLSVAGGMNQENFTAGLLISYRNYSLQYAFENNPDLDLDNIHRLSVDYFLP